MIKPPEVRTQEELTYDRYLKVSALTSLQELQSDPPHHDELLFIIIHQAYELWFKLILHELSQAVVHMERGEVLRARHFTQRVVNILRLLVDQIHILETMTPADFLEFRDRLNPASGFQSSQFREVEFFAGLKDPAFLRFFQHYPEQQARLQARLDGPDLRTVYEDLLRRLGFAIPDDPLKDDAARLETMEAILPIYQDPEAHLPLYLLTESLIEIDEYLILWRLHHAHVVERIIGHKRGTGGSSGVDYLQATARKKCFPLLWEVRTLLRKDPLKPY
jgi:tryptophan 2,3-dioxygenase